MTAIKVRAFILFCSCFLTALQTTVSQPDSVSASTTAAPTTAASTTAAPTTAASTTAAPTTAASTTAAPTTAAPTTAAPTTAAPTTAAAITATPTTATPTTQAPTTTQAVTTLPPPTAAPTTTPTPPPTPPPITVTASMMRNYQFSCLRPTTPCNSFRGFCQQTTGNCVCLQNSYGLQCEVPGIFPPNGGQCQTSNPCVRGTCFFDGRGVHCACPDGFYGNRCQNRMIHVECHRNGMLLNVFPYGYSVSQWANRSPPLLNNCRIPPVATFTNRWPQYFPRQWQGFTGAFFHRNDPCAGNAMVSETATTISYSRDLYIPYDFYSRHFTDTFIRITCNIPKSLTGNQQPPSPSAPRVLYNLIDQNGQALQGPVQRGDPIGLALRLRPIPNTRGLTDIGLMRCQISNGQTSITVLENGCPVGPIGRRVVKPADGTRVLFMSTADFPPGSLNWSFQCSVRLCISTDMRCSMANNCNGGKRRKREITDEADSTNVVLVSSDFTLSN